MRTADCSAVLFLAGPALLRGAGHQAVAPAFAIFEGWAFLLPTAGDFQIFFTLISAVRGGLPIVAMQPVRQGRRQFAVTNAHDIGSAAPTCETTKAGANHYRW